MSISTRLTAWRNSVYHARVMSAPEVIRRHTRATRLLHWVNALCVFLVLMSGLQIFNADPLLYWGQHGASPDRALLAIGAHGFPHWATLPSWQALSAGRRWHFFFAWMLVANSALYLLFSLISGHVRRDLLPSRTEIAPAHLLHDIWNHMRLRFPTGQAAKRYNVLQKLAYVGVIFVLAPLILATGLTMSPGLDAAFPWLVHLFGGRPSARTIHFTAAMLVAAFIAVHLLMLILAGAWNEVRSMITGRYVVPVGKTTK